MNEVISGRYRLLDVIGTGGMSTVYRAKDEKDDDRIVAIKVLKPEYWDNADYVKRFRHEAAAASKVSHPNIVNLYSVDNDGKMQYIVMEYIDGRTLKDIILKEGPLPAKRAVRYALKILAALDEAHSKHIIHRDIKPQNILVDKNDTIKVADFGIARLVDSKTGTLTDSNTVLGSVHYFSPEQANGDNVDEKSDLYSMGIVLYEMLTGKVPFEGDNAVAIALKHMNEVPRSIQSINDKVPKAIDEVVMKAIEKDPMMRYAKASDMAKDLRKALKAPEGGVVDQRRRGGRVGSYLLKNGLNILLVGLSCIILIAMLIYGIVKVSDILYGVDVPETVGLDYDEAFAKITAADMGTNVEYRYSNIYAGGIVIDQTPDGGTRGRRKKDVNLVVSMGLEPVTLPNTVGMTKSEALKLLSEYGFPTVYIEYNYIENTELDTVLLQLPSEETAQPGTDITLTVNSAPIIMPSLIGKTRQQALDTLEALALHVEVIEGYSNDDLPDTVVLQNPPLGTSLIRGSSVSITVALTNPVTYYATYNRVIPLAMQVRIVLRDPKGTETEVYNGFCEASQVVSLSLSGPESGEHELDVYYDGALAYTEKVVFE